MARLARNFPTPLVFDRQQQEVTVGPGLTFREKPGREQDNCMADTDATSAEAGSHQAGSQRRRMSLGRLFLWGLWGIAGLVLLVAAFYGEEDFRHLRAWEEYKKSSGLGERPLDWKAGLPQPVPELENFAATPLLKAVGMKGHRYPEIANRLSSVPAGGFLSDAFAGKPADFDGFVGELAARGTVSQDPQSNTAQLALQGFQPVAADLAELRQASLRRYAQFPVQGEDPMTLGVPNFIVARALSQMLCLRADAFLATGQSEEALLDLKTVFRLSDALESSPTLVAAMIRVALHGILLGPFRDGVVQGKWSNQQLAELQALFQKANLLAGVSVSMEAGERAAMHHLVLKRPDKLLEMFAIPDSHARNVKEFLSAKLRDWVIRLAPRGWYYRALMDYDQPVAEFRVAIDPSARRVDLDRIRRAMNRAQMHINQGGPFALLLGVALPNLDRACAVTARTQTMLHLAAVVCALERCKLETDAYPESLNDLAPKYLSKVPHDVLTGAAFVYHRVDDRGYRLSAIAPVVGKPGAAPTGQLRSKSELAWVN